MGVEVKLENFEGPLDLLLQLIEKNKVDIYDIPISMIADQYMEYVEKMQEERLDILSDFLVMASTLLDIKSRMLLPREEDENGEEIDPRQELVERLIEYKEFKMRAKELSGYYYTDTMPLFKEGSIPKEILHPVQEIDMEELLEDVTLKRLQETFQMLMERQEDKVDPIRAQFGNIKKDPVRLSDKLTYILDAGPKKKRFSFKNLIEGQKSKADCVVTFLACLELIKVGQLLVSQEETFGDIELTWNENCDRKITKEDMAQYD